MVLTVLSGMTYMEHLQDNLRTYSPLVPLTDEDKAFLEETARQMHEYPTIPCNDCKYCMPCPYGIDIPAVLLHYNRCVNEGNLSSSRDDSNYREARRAFLIGYDRSVPKLRQASHCIGCGQCIEHCPQSINIPPASTITPKCSDRAHSKRTRRQSGNRKRQVKARRFFYSTQISSIKMKPSPPWPRCQSGIVPKFLAKTLTYLAFTGLSSLNMKSFVWIV